MIYNQLSGSTGSDKILFIEVSMVLT